MTGKPPTASPRAEAMSRGRQADSARRRQRVITALDRALAQGDEISVSGIARAAGVDRSFLYRHHELLEKIHAAEAVPATTGTAIGPVVTRASLQADLLAAHERAVRLSMRNQRLDRDPGPRGTRRAIESSAGEPPEQRERKQPSRPRRHGTP